MSLYRGRTVIPIVILGRQKILDDPLYMQCFGITGMNQDIAARVTYIKRALDELMPSIPMNMRGGINEFGTYFVSIIQVVFQVQCIG